MWLFGTWWYLVVGTLFHVFYIVAPFGNSSSILCFFFLVVVRID